MRPSWPTRSASNTSRRAHPRCRSPPGSTRPQRRSPPHKNNQPMLSKFIHPGVANSLTHSAYIHLSPKMTISQRQTTPTPSEGQPFIKSWSARKENAIVGIVFGILLLISGCSKIVSFQEEVEIAPGEIVVINRQREYEQKCEGPSCGWGSVSDNILKGGPISATWSGARRTPMLLARVETGELVLIDIRGYCIGPKYQQYVLKEDHWERQPLDARFHDLLANLLIGSSTDKTFPSFISILEKTKRASRPGYSNSRRRILPNTPGNC